MADQRGEGRLDGWKSIARHLGRDERTVRRWETRGLPVRRVPGGPRAPVYATAGELDRWLNTHAAVLAEAEAGLQEATVDPGDTGSDPPAAHAAPETADSLRVDAVPRSTRIRRLRLPGLAAVGFGVAAIFAVARPMLHPAASSIAPAAAPTLAAPIDPQARADFLNGSHAWSLRTPASLDQARADFGAAIAREPGYAAAYAGLANTYLLLREFGAMSDAEAYPKAAAAAETALRLDPELAAAHRARAFALYWGQRQPAAAWAEFDRAGALAPGEALTWHWYATALDGAGRYAEATRMIERARALDPGSTAILTDEGLILYGAGRKAEGRAELARVVALEPRNADAHLYLARIARAEGRAADSRTEARLADELRGTRPAGDARPDRADVPDSPQPTPVR